MTYVLIALAAFAGAFVYCSFFEWALHRFIMHSERWMKYPYRSHQLEHHEIFKADDSYFIPGPGHEQWHMEHVTFAWWNAPLLFLLHAPLFLVVYFFLGGVPALIGAASAMAGYYMLYE